MMPFEANIRLLANVVSEDDNYDKLKVSFSASGQDKLAKHKVDQIKIKWELVKAMGADEDAKDAKGEANFDPLNVGESISKAEIALLEEVLKRKREEVKA